MTARPGPSGQDAAGLPNAVASSTTDLLAEVIEVMSDGVALFDENAVLITCNARFRALNHLLADVLIPGIGWDMLLREAVSRGVLDVGGRDRLRWMEARLDESPGNLESVVFETVNGAIMEMSLRPVAMGGFVVTQTDITSRLLYEENEKQADLLLRKVLEACPANVVMSRIGDGYILYRSPAATALLGTARHASEHFASREERADFITALLPEGRVDNMQVTGLRPDGRRFPCQISAQLIEYKGEDVVVSSTVDISGDIEMRRALADQREQIFQAEKMSALGELLAGVAHELNNPLSVVVGHALMMQEESSDPEGLRRIEKISEAAQRCGRIVKSFLAMARQQPVELAPTDIARTVADAVDALKQGAEGLRAVVNIDIPDGLPPAMADAHQITQVTINLIRNADQAIRDSGVGDAVGITALHDPAADVIELRIADNGPGVPRDIRTRIFDPLFTTKDIGRGTGIGLAFCHRVLTGHSGTIRLLDDDEAGAVFVVRLPVANARALSDQTGTRDTHAALPGPVLLVDDETDVTDLVREVLRKEGFAVDTTTSAEMALSLLQERSYALILSDLNMPGIGGRGLYEAILRTRPELARRVGFITGDTMSPQVGSFLETAARPFLEKPVSPNELRKLVHDMLAAVRPDGGGE